MPVKSPLEVLYLIKSNICIKQASVKTFVQNETKRQIKKTGRKTPKTCNEKLLNIVFFYRYWINKFQPLSFLEKCCLLQRNENQELIYLFFFHLFIYLFNLTNSKLRKASSFCE